jgi:hypothetical protein
MNGRCSFTCAAIAGMTLLAGCVANMPAEATAMNGPFTR